MYEKTRSPSSTAPVIDYPVLRIEMAVMASPENIRETLRMFYVHKSSPGLICKRIGVRPRQFHAWMYLCRQMVITRLSEIRV